MKTTAHTLALEQVLETHGRFFQSQIRQYLPPMERDDAFQDFSVHLYQLIQKRFDEQAHLFDSKAWLRTVVVHFCISELRKRQALKNQVWIQTTTDKIVVAQESSPEKEELIRQFFEQALGCLTKYDALVLKLKYCYNRPTKEIEARLQLKHADVYIARLKEKIRKKMGRIDSQFWQEMNR
ncbi:MAG: hypothetical protein RLZZ301_1741 [Bacteroidota bacterium]|jgi:RNA polymerase sigma factor (sigma-70 family)